MTLTTNHGVIEVALDAAGGAVRGRELRLPRRQAVLRQHALPPPHRRRPPPVLQCGDPSGTGTGGPTYQYAEENLASLGTSTSVYKRGLVGVARAQDSGDQRLAVLLHDQEWQLPPDYIPLGTVTRGLDVLDNISAGGITPGTSAQRTARRRPQVTLQRVTVAYS